MSKKVLVFFPHNPYPPTTGAHKRCWEVLNGLRSQGCAVTLVSSTLTSDAKWDEASIRGLKDNGLAGVHVWEPVKNDHRFIYVLKVLHKKLKREIGIDSAIYTPPGMRSWFARIFDEVRPDVLLMNYVHWDGLVRPRMRRSASCVVDMLDLVTLHRQMADALQTVLWQYPSPIRAADVDGAILDEDYFEALGLKPDPAEFRIYDRYRHTIAISPAEAQAVQESARKTNVVFLPMTHDVFPIENDYSGPAYFPTGPNPLNFQGYLYFVRKVLPLVRAKQPDFVMEVTGTVCKYFQPEEGVQFRGFVPDLQDIYRTCRFVACPNIGTTGQQTKLVEAMAHGVPVIALRRVAEGTALRHNVNGLVAENAAEFAEHTLRLWNDRDLCRKLGEAGRETVAQEFSRDCLKQRLTAIL